MTKNESNKINAVIFDLDGVIVSTDECHYQSWKCLADEEGIYFSREINERLRGVSRMESLEIILEKSPKLYSDAEKQELADRKNKYYRELIRKLTPRDILPGVMSVLAELKTIGIKIGIGSSSKNSPMILERIGLNTYFDATADGNDISRSKPDPEVFLLAASRLGVQPHNCLVVEDAEAGIEAAISGGMRVLAIGGASQIEKATFRARDLRAIDFSQIL